MENKNNSGVMIVLGIVLLVVMFVLGLFLGGKFSNLENKTNNEVINSANEIIDMAKDNINEAAKTVKDDGLTQEEFYNKVKGTWYRTSDTGWKYGFDLSAKSYNGVDVNFYNAYQCGSDGGIQGTIFSFKYLGNDVYQVYSYDEGCNGSHCVDEKEPTVNRALIDISDIDNKNIKVRYEDSSNSDGVVYKLWESEKYLCE